MEYFESMIDQLTKRAARATLGQFNLSSKPLREFLWQQFSKAPGQPGAFLGTPVFEATFGWQEHTKTMKELANGFLQPELVKAMDNPPKELAEDYRFGADWKPYSHQYEAWTHLTADDPRSVIVSSGTGSGKTECFLVPILNDIVKRNSKAGAVEALFLYPLNALINSQQERLTAWSHGLGSDVKFCLYNGETKETVPAASQRDYANQQLSRKGLRDEPSQILVTNATMLEYMLVRQKDQPILSKSKGKLRWIVLDEAHTYIGSQAAELSLLLRRVMHGFDVKPEQVRFVATSATIGDKDSENELKAFLADVAGIDISQVHLVKGHREIEPLQELESPKAMDIDKVSAIADSVERYQALESIMPLRVLRQHLSTDNNRLSLTEIRKILSATDVLIDETTALKWLDVCSSTMNLKGEAFIPFRLHLFHRVSSGLWACSNPSCDAKKGTALDSVDWRFGMVYMSRQERCNCCHSPVFEMISCSGCGSTLLLADETTDLQSGDAVLTLPKPDSNIDDFALDLEDDDSAEFEDFIEEEVNTKTKNTILSDIAYEETSDHWLDPQGVLKTSRFEHAFKVNRVREYKASEGNARALRCPCCQHTQSRGFEFYRHFRNGAPFMLSTVLPTLLEFCRDGKKEQLKGPWNGRRMITFTDSRQGTARFAAKSQQDSERQFLRAALFHLIVDRTLKSGVLSAEDAKKLATFKGRLAMFVEDGDQDMIEVMEDKIASLCGGGNVSIPWQDVEKELIQENELKYWIKDSYRHFSEKMALVKDPLLLARLLLLREFNSRPKRQNTLETLGLIRMEYPALKDKGNTAPTEWKALFSDIVKAQSTWINFLTLCLNFHVRAVKAISLTPEQSRWIGAKFSTGFIAAPDSNSIGNVQRWPQVRKGVELARQARLVRLLAVTFNLDIDDTLDRANINGILQSAWNVLQYNVLSGSGDGYRLELERTVSFSLNSEKWQCPRTHKIIDTPLEKITPYLSNKGTRDEQVCQLLEAPSYPYPYGRRVEDGSTVPLSEIRDWQEQPAITALRKENAWSDISDRIVERTPYFRVAEHSAQLPASLLRDYERKFKQGAINVLSCSTTMEMGVDIGGITVVAMNNVPPNPANYQQRAGRAGRRGESQSVALTLCKNTPHGEHVFNNPRWAFDTPIHVPVVSLSSVYIVKRHVNALLLSEFLRQTDQNNDSLRLSCGNFFLSAHEACSSQAELFINWCMTDALDMVADGLETLLLRTPLQVTPKVDILLDVVSEMRERIKTWKAEYLLLEEQSEAIKSDSNRLSVAQAAVDCQIQRMENEYLLSELARKGFLPGYGFPTDVISLNNDTIESINLRMWKIEAIKTQKSASNDAPEHRIDSRFTARDYPSRDLASAIRDYAPGSQVVIDGRVYRSDGVILNWHSPASADQVKEIQSLKWAWRCPHCGASGTSVKQPTTCTCCGESLDDKTASNKQRTENYHYFIEPGSFAVDIRSEPDNDISKLTYIPVKDPWVTVEQADWQEISINPSVKFRSSHDGHIYYHSSGTSDCGYALCLECGRMEPMPDNENISPSKVLEGHTRLRGGKGELSRMSDKMCGGNEREFSIKGPIKLGYSTRTDVFELILFHADGSVLNDRNVARSISVLLRNELAEKLGINNDEIGCTSKPVNYNQAPAQAVVLYDSAEGGAGFVIQAQEHLIELLQKVQKKANSCSCDKACHRCLVDYSTQHVIELLNRHDVYRFLDLDFFARLELSNELKIFDKKNRRELRPILNAIEQSIGRHESPTICLYLAKENIADLSNWMFNQVIRHWADKHRIDIVLVNEQDEALSVPEQIALYWLSQHANIKLVQRVTPIDKETTIFAEIRDNDIVHSWGIKAGYESLLITGLNDAAEFKDVTLKVTSQPEKIGTVKIHDELNRGMKEFGALFWTHVFQASDLILKKMRTHQLVNVEYCDRYLAAPLPLGLCLTTMGSILNFYKDCKVTIYTAAFKDQKGDMPSTVMDNWEGEQDRLETVASYLANTSLKIDFKTVDKRQMPHARTIVLTFDDGHKITIWLDQGFGYWWVDKREPKHHLKPNVTPNDLAHTMTSNEWKLQSGHWPTTIFFEIQD